MHKTFAPIAFTLLASLPLIYSGPCFSQATEPSAEAAATIDLLKNTKVSTFAFGLMRLSDYVKEVGNYGTTTDDGTKHTYMGSAGISNGRILLMFYEDDMMDKTSVAAKCELMLMRLRVGIRDGRPSAFAYKFATADTDIDEVNFASIDSLIDIRIAYSNADCTAPLLGKSYTLTNR